MVCLPCLCLTPMRRYLFTSPCPAPSLAQMLGIRNTKPLASRRGQMHQEEPLCEEDAGGGELVRGRAGLSQPKGLRSVIRLWQPQTL